MEIEYEVIIDVTLLAKRLLWLSSFSFAASIPTADPEGSFAGW